MVLSIETFGWSSGLYGAHEHVAWVSLLRDYHVAKTKVSCCFFFLFFFLFFFCFFCFCFFNPFSHHYYLLCFCPVVETRHLKDHYFLMDEVLGRGGFGAVYAGVCKRTGRGVSYEYFCFV